MDQNDLVSLQQSSKRIRNPFGFDFTVKWAGKPITLSGDGEWYAVIAPLADHIARRLYMKIRYQFHDEQVAAMKAKGDDRLARAFNVPAEIENKIMMLITGEPIHKNVSVADSVEDEADLSILKKEMKALESKGLSGGSQGINVSKILEKATIEALPLADKLDGRGGSGHVAGSANLSGVTPDVTPVDTTPVNVADIQANPSVLPAADVAPSQNVAPATPSAVQNPAPGEFGELNQLDHDAR